MKKSYVWANLLMVVVIGCGSDSDPVSLRSKPKVEVTFENQSQFNVETVIVHTEVDNYLEGEKILETPITTGNTHSFSLPSSLWYVTVYRRPNKDSSPLAYTTGYSWDIEKYKKIIYFDEQFRVAN